MTLPGWRSLPRPVQGTLLVFVGLIGLIVPVLPGWPLLISGLVILSDYCPPLKRLLDRILAHPRIRRCVEWTKGRWQGEAGKASL